MQETLIAGDTLNYRATAPAYTPEDGWSLMFRLVPRSAGAAAIDVVGIASDGGWLVQVLASDTAAWSAGTYGWSAWVDRAGEVYTIESGQLTVRANPRTAAPGADTRLQSEIDLEAIQATLRGKASSATLMYQINGRRMESYTLTELLKLEAKYKREVDADRAAAGLVPQYGSGPRRILVRCG